MRLEEVVNRHYHQLNDNDMHILKYILNHAQTCYQLSINELARACNVSKSSVLRFTQKLGFSGYSEFKVFLKWDNRREKTDSHYIEPLYTDIDATLNDLSDKSFDAISELLYQARTIFVYGSGVAQTNCALELQRQFANAQRHLVVIHDQTEFEIIQQSMTPEDVIIIISLSGDTPALIPQAEWLAAKGVPIISVTNLKNNKIAQMATHHLYATSTFTSVTAYRDIISFVPFAIVLEHMFRHYLTYEEKRDHPDQ
ncbi:MurR/RpiR family transcriptional regulator [Salipaludibacillus agaradhaerens]|uniref:MurR/RpiR family transcriptional regulator n=1 Tax=Salipaludibacillus agaradhaerens TaxID=76935 RepID=A0A9Q4B5A9_SALAG|nr:MurR/RpiR family transcriptional regulator [Salipaludibacillus agaradhaerens]MCR6098723.1 MurR/RpiR family transcriptional regulator [Salipaludibacillus agaradhaerens]MCR6115730.1 MurR/RpiR family transcriptional regulator [Salipaludibacillus agaradhaerens]